jgi:trehalose synthase
MTSMMTERLRAPGSAREARSLVAARARTGDRLAGRTVWCLSGLRSARDSAGTLSERLRRTGAAARRVEAPGDEGLRHLCERLDGLLRGSIAGEPGPEDGGVYAGGVEHGEEVLGAAVAPGDVVVLHDPLTAVVAVAARERGAHVVWRLPAVAVRRRIPGPVAWTFMRRSTGALDAYVAVAGGPEMQRIIAVVPSRGMVAAKEVDPAQRDAGWSSVLADVIQADRDQTVGGIFHARPAVAAR